MTVYVDSLSSYSKSPLGHREWCHMWADDLEELHIFASRIGLKKSWFQDDRRLPHYDLTAHKRNAALKFGAVQHSLVDWLRARHPL